MLKFLYFVLLKLMKQTKLRLGYFIILLGAMLFHSTQAQVQNITPPNTFYPTVEVPCGKMNFQFEYGIRFSEQMVNGKTEVTTYLNNYPSRILEYAVVNKGNLTELFMIEQGSIEPFVFDPSLVNCYAFNLGNLPTGPNNLRYISAVRTSPVSFNPSGFLSNFVYRFDLQSFMVNGPPQAADTLSIYGLILLILAMLAIVRIKGIKKISLILLFAPPPISFA